MKPRVTPVPGGLYVLTYRSSDDGLIHTSNPWPRDVAIRRGRRVAMRQGRVL